MKKTIKAHSLVELLVAIAIFAMITSSVIGLAVETVRTYSQAEDNAEASVFFQEKSQAILSLKNQNWGLISSLTDQGEKHLVFAENAYTTQDGRATESMSGKSFTYYFTVTKAYRDTSSNFVETPGTLDAHSRRIDFVVEWIDSKSIVRTNSFLFYLSDWNTSIWQLTTDTQFNTGTYQQTIGVKVADGEVRLQSMFYADWCKPVNSLVALDLPKNGVANSIDAIQGRVYAGTGENSSGISLADVRITDTNPPVATVVGTKDGYKTNDIFTDGSYIYIATDSNSAEVAILQASDYTQVGYYDAPGSTDASAVFVTNNVGYVLQGNKLRNFNLSSQTGSRPAVDSDGVSLSGTGTGLYVKGNYAYVTESWSIYELEVFNLTTPTNITRVGYADLNISSSIGVYVNDSETRAYILTSSSLFFDEVFIVDITTKTGNRPTLSSIDLGGMTPRDMRAMGDKAVVVGTGGYEYQVFNIKNESAITRCGTLNVDSGINALDTVAESDGDLYAYVVTGDSASELKIILGGPGGGGADGNGYLAQGTYTSPVFDTGSATSTFYTFTVNGTIPTGSSISGQFRTSSRADFADTTWIGADGTASSYITSMGTYNIPASIATNKRYFQYRFVLNSDTIVSPVIEETILNYQK